MAITKKALENPNDGYFERVYEMLDDLEKKEAIKKEPSPKGDRPKKRSVKLTRTDGIRRPSFFYI